MDVGEVVVIALAGLAAGAINTVVGSGTLITFPVLLAFGYAPVTANVSNTIGLVPGSVSGAIGYRRELEGQKQRAIRLGIMSLLGGALGAALLLILPASAFKAIVPVFIAIALVLVIVQPKINAWLAHRERRADGEGGIINPIWVFACGIYGGYFGAAQGILVIGLLGITLPQSLQRTNALKNVLTAIVNAVAGVYFAIAAHVAWGPAAIIAVSSMIGGQIGAHYGRRLHPAALRGVIVVVGVTAIVRLLAT